MLYKEQLDEFLDACIDIAGNSEQCLKAYMLNIPLTSFAVDVSGSSWDTDYCIKGIEFNFLSEITPIKILVDLDFFKDTFVIGNFFRELTHIKYTFCDTLKFIQDVWQYDGFDVQYVVVSQDNKDNTNQVYRYLCSSNDGNMTYLETIFRIDICGGIHLFKSMVHYLSSPYTIESSVLEHLKNCEVKTESILLFYDDYDLLTKNNIALNGVLNYRVGVLDCTKETARQVRSIIEYKKEHPDIGLTLVVLLLNYTDLGHGHSLNQPEHNLTERYKVWMQNIILDLLSSGISLDADNRVVFEALHMEVHNDVRFHDYFRIMGQNINYAVMNNYYSSIKCIDYYFKQWY